MAHIAPSLLAAPLGNLHRDLSALVDAGARFIHVDVMDGQFVPPISFGADMVTFAKSVPGTFVEAHLMTIQPEHLIDSFAKAGADRIIVHQEVSPHLHRVLGRIKELGLSSGVAINPATPLSAITEVLELADLVLIMTVNPGWGGQPFISSCLQKISNLTSIIRERGSSTIIEVDGGINEETIAPCVKAGASLLVAGSALFRGNDLKASYSKLQKRALEMSATV
jgi:ribulose-phosphate 3-epimerase